MYDVCTIYSYRNNFVKKKYNIRILYDIMTEKDEHEKEYEQHLMEICCAHCNSRIGYAQSKIPRLNIICGECRWDIICEDVYS